MYSASGHFCEVINTWRGKESDCYQIAFGSGHVVTSTFNHPFLTENGWKRADELKESENLLDEDGNSERLSVLRKPMKRKMNLGCNSLRRQSLQHAACKLRCFCLVWQVN